MTTVSQSPVPQDVFETYAGKWVAIRQGREVVAVADTLRELRESPKLRPTDALFHVPTSNSVFF